MIADSDWRNRLTSVRAISHATSAIAISHARAYPKADFYEVWDTEDLWKSPDVIISLAMAGGAPRKQLILAVCAVARLCIHLVPEGENSPRIAVTTTEEWCKDEITEMRVREVADEIRPLVSEIATAYYSSSLTTSAARFAALSTIDMVFNDTAAYSVVACTERTDITLPNFQIRDTMRKFLPFERPAPKKVTYWQRLAEED